MLKQTMMVGYLGSLACNVLLARSQRGVSRAKTN